MQKTLSESLFEALCAEVGLRVSVVQTSAERTPDYELIVSGQRVIAEVKQMDPSKEDLQHQKRTLDGVIEAYGDTPGRRIRRMIDSGKEQIKVRTGDTLPGLLVIYNNVPFLSALTEPLFVLMGMYGQMGVTVEVPRNPAEEPIFRDTRLLGNRRMTDKHNQSISAVCVLQGTIEGEKKLSFYHNVFARAPFDPKWLRDPVVEHYTVNDPGSGAFSDWVKI